MNEKASGGEGCMLCGAPRNDISKRGEMVACGYNSNYDRDAFVVQRDFGNGDGELCDACMAVLIRDGNVIPCVDGGELLRGLPAAAYQAMIRDGMRNMRHLLERALSPLQRLNGVVPTTTRNPFMAGMMAELMARSGVDMDGVVEQYAGIMCANDEMEKYILSAFEDNLTGSVAPEDEEQPSGE